MTDMNEMCSVSALRARLIWLQQSKESLEVSHRSLLIKVSEFHSKMTEAKTPTKRTYYLRKVNQIKGVVIKSAVAISQIDASIKKVEDAITTATSPETE